MRSIARGVRGAAAALRRPLWVPPGHYYSPIAGPSDVDRALARAGDTGAAVPGVDLRADAQRALVTELAPLWADLPDELPMTAATGWRYHQVNAMFGLADAAVYSAMLRHLRPRRVIEVGSGFSSAIALDTADRWLPEVSFTFVEPYPERLLGLLDERDRARTTLLRAPVQDVPLSTYDALCPGDLLFVDSTHVSKAGSDVNWLVFEVLPRLADGVVVHFHDVFWPFEYPREWLREGRGWTENYLLRAFLAYNTRFEILLFNSWLWQAERELVARTLPATLDQHPGGIWLRKVPG
ncbi:MAG TPA: class I SAM-dependent methyltransferase [Pseudonocardiaceae bacterium]